MLARGSARCTARRWATARAASTGFIRTRATAAPSVGALSGGAAGDSFPDQVVGIVEAWGRIELHEDGFRAQFARPHTLALIGAPRESDIGG